MTSLKLLFILIYLLVIVTLYIYHCMQPLYRRCTECTVHHEQKVREEQHHINVARTSNNRVISSDDLYCCLLPSVKRSTHFPLGLSDRNNTILVSMFFKQQSTLNYVKLTIG